MSENQNLNWKFILNQLVKAENLSAEQAEWAMDSIMSGETPDGVLGAFLLGLHAKGETSGEIQALAKVMISKAESIDVSRDAVDIVGTGGDQQNTVNISTMAALVIAGAGIPVIKHGNRSSSSASGSADVLEALGVNLNLPIKEVAGAVEAAGITFLFAQAFHPSMRFVAPVRRSLGIPTTFNYLGPMTNPARVRSSAVGVANATMAQKMAEVFAERGDHALVFRGGDGLDELTITGPSQVWETKDGGVSALTFDPRDYGFTYARLEDLRGGDAAHNAAVFRDILSGAEGPIRDAVLLNAAAGITAYRPAGPATFDTRFREALALAQESIDSGEALRALERWMAYSAQHC